MQESNSYSELAKKDLQAAKLMLSGELWNHSARFCQQYVEKILKGFIYLNGEADDFSLLSTHNLIKLADKVAILRGTKFTKNEINWFRTLKDYYFDTNYPGDNYVELLEEDAHDAYTWTMEFKKQYETSLSQTFEARKVDSEISTKHDLQCSFSFVNPDNKGC